MERGKSKDTIKQSLRKLKPGLIDAYIIKKFIGTFFFSLALIMGIAVIFDFAEKLDEFIQKNAPVRAIIFDYYLNFIPYFATLFAPMFVFITVIFFTSKMAYNTEIIAILNSGMSFRRMMYPYFISAAFIALFTFSLTNFVIPHSNIVRLDFEAKYWRDPGFRRISINSIHRQVYPNVYVYMGSYNSRTRQGNNFTIEKYDDHGKLLSKLSAKTVRWDTVSNKWGAWNYSIRNIDSLTETITTGRRIDTTLTIRPADFGRTPEFVGTMTYGELKKYVRLLRMQGSDELKLYLNEYHRRFANPYAIFILTLIGVSLSSKKIRGGIGMQIGLGLLLSFSYILFQQFSSQFSLKGSLSPLLAMWIPNIIFTIIAFVLYRLAPK
ncbi:MAG TPA: LptF/LptG family permease [Bacteroidales bacterium]|nr:LptF/LptG family permease [Bacteroidales bacterium]HPT12645.1 LptF/LptG family permease [Bacteroidales bacterium]